MTSACYAYVCNVAGGIGPHKGDGSQLFCLSLAERGKPYLTKDTYPSLV